MEDSLLASVAQLQTSLHDADLDKLPSRQKQSIAGAVAFATAFLPKHQSTEQWRERFLHRVVVGILKLPEEQVESVLPISSSTLLDRADSPLETAVTSCPFRDEVPTRDQRFRCILGIMVHLLADQQYDSRARTALRRMSRLWGIPWSVMGRAEDAFVLGLAVELRATANAKKRSSSGRWWKIAAAGVVGGGLLVVTGGLAAPFIAAGVASLGAVGGVVGTAAVSLGTFMGSVGGTALLISLFGAAGSGLGSYRMDRRTAGLHVFFFDRLTASPRSLVHKLEHRAEEAVEQAVRQEESGAAEQEGKDATTGSAPAGAGGAARPKDDMHPAAASRSSDKHMAWESRVEEDTFQEEAEEEEAEEGAPTAAGMHVFIVVSGLVYDKSKVDFHTPWGGRANARVPPPPLTDAVRELVGADQQQQQEQEEEEEEEEEEQQPHAQRGANGAPPAGEDGAQEAPPRRDEAGKTVSDAGAEREGGASVGAEERSDASSSSEDEFEDDEVKLSEVRVGWFRHMIPYGETYTVVWEPEILEKLGSSLQVWMRNFVVNKAVKEVLKQTVLRGLLAAWAWPSTALSLLSNIDSPWAMGINRAEKAGKALAEVLWERQQGQRPVTLIGYSLGARVIFECMEELARRAKSVEEEIAAEEAAEAGKPAQPTKRRGPLGWITGTKGKPSKKAQDKVSASRAERLDRAYGAVQDVILLGAPVTAAPDRWRAVRAVASGRVVNGYCSTDFVLRFVFRANQLAWHVAGVGPVGMSDVKAMQQNERDSETTVPAPPDAPSAPAGGGGGRAESGELSAEAEPEEAETDAETVQAGREAMQAELATDGEGAQELDNQSREAFRADMQQMQQMLDSNEADAAAEEAEGDPLGGAARELDQSDLSNLPPPTVHWFEGIENVDLGPVVSGHLSYRYRLEAICRYIKLEGIDSAEIHGM